MILKMNRSINHLTVRLVLGLALCCSSRGEPAESADSAQAKAKLAQIRGRIAALTSHLGTELKERDSLNARLRAADLSITDKRQHLEALRAAQLATVRHRNELRAEQSRNQSALQAQRLALASQVRAAYQIGQQEQIKLLLNQSDPAAAGRIVTYYGYFVRARGAKIDEIRVDEQRLAEISAEIEQTAQKQQLLEADTAREVAELQHAREEHVTALTAVSTEVSSGNQRLGELKREEQAEEALLADLAQVLQDFPVDEAQQSFASLRGKLPWPVPGKISAGIRHARDGAGPAALRRSGLLIDTARGAKVRAPYFGRVMYADWLPGLGLLLIIGHSGDYMTMYGHAEVLYKSVGDWVAPGDVIASVSESGASPPQLYFEIREGRKPIDASQWLKSAP